MNKKGIIFTIASAVLYGVTPALASVTYSMGSNAETLVFLRNIMVVPVLAVIMLIKGIDFKLKKHQVLPVIVIAVFGAGLATLTLYSSYAYIGISVATTLHFLYPVFVALLCRMIYKEKLSRLKIGVLCVASFGILLFLEPGGMGKNAWLGIVLSIFSGLAYSFYMIGMEKKQLTKIEPMKMTFYMGVCIAFAMMIYNIPFRIITLQLPPLVYLYSFFIAISTSFLAVALLQLGIKYLNATTAAIFCLFEPIFSNICGVLFLGEVLSVAKILGSVIILGAAGILAWVDGRAAPEDSAEEKEISYKK